MPEKNICMPATLYRNYENKLKPGQPFLHPFYGPAPVIIRGYAMKILLPACITLLLIVQGCVTTFVPLMPNQPMPTDKGQVQFSGALGASHAEGQFSHSVCPNFATYAGIYRGFNGASQYEAGGMLYTPASKAKEVFFAAGGGYGHGTYKNYYRWENPTKKVNIEFTSWHMQYAVYLDLSDKKSNVILGFCYKHERVHFLQYSLQDEGPNGATPVVTLSAADVWATVGTGYAVLQANLGNKGVYFKGQFGIRGVKGFKPDFNRGVTSAPSRNIMHPVIDPIMLNLSLGYRFNIYN